MNIQATTQAVHHITSDALLVAAARKSAGQGEKGVQLSPAAASVDELLGGLILERAADGEFKGNLGELLTIHPMGRLAVKRVIVVGLGTPEKITTQAIRRASSTAARHLQNTGAQQITLALNWDSNNYDAAQGVQAEVEGVLLGLYTFRIYQNKENNGQNISQLQVLTDDAHKAES